MTIKQTCFPLTCHHGRCSADGLIHWILHDVGHFYYFLAFLNPQIWCGHWTLEERSMNSHCTLLDMFNLLIFWNIVLVL